jgi:hypothetical protein
MTGARGFYRARAGTDPVFVGRERASSGYRRGARADVDAGARIFSGAIRTVRARPSGANAEWTGASSGPGRAPPQPRTLLKIRVTKEDLQIQS